MIHLSNYDPQWPKLYLAEKNRLSAIKRSELIVAIEHVGSTAIPGLSAKPIIDILVGVTDIQLLDDLFVSEICDLGYFYKSEYENLMPFRKYFKRKVKSLGFNLHVVTFQSDFFNRLINFRNILLSNETVLIRPSRKSCSSRDWVWRARAAWESAWMRSRCSSSAWGLAMRAST